MTTLAEIAASESKLRALNLALANVMCRVEDAVALDELHTAVAAAILDHKEKART